jgi:predicted nucleic acid-binding protein
VIAVDTSVWIQAFRGRDRRTTQALRDLIDRGSVALPVPVRVEILSGCSRTDMPRVRRALSALPVLVPTTATWDRIDAWVVRAVGAGERFGLGDLVIGAIAADHEAAIWSRDADFERMARLGFVEIHLVDG